MLKKLLKKTHLYPLLKNARITFLDKQKEQLIKQSAKYLEYDQYNNIVNLGVGKDGITFKANNKNGKMVVVKVLSDYSKLFLPITFDLMEKFSDLEFFYKVKISKNKYFEYDYEELHHLRNFKIKEFCLIFIEICKLQKKMLEKDMIVWDFGFSAPNYMLSEDKCLRWIDYGGSGFLYLKQEGAPISAIRKNLVYARTDFVNLSVILHWICFVLGDFSVQKLMTELQDGKVSFEDAYNFSKDRVEGTGIDFILQIKNLDLLKKEDWVKFKLILIEQTQKDSMKTLEAADIDKVTIHENSVEVSGYQNYSISDGLLVPKTIGHEWAPSLKKWEIVNNILLELNVEGTYLDIGSNLGMYVFSAHINHGLESYGIDYNQVYINECNEIASKLNLGCSFQIKNFSDIDLEVDYISALGIIHHLFHRTEDYNDLTPIMEKFSRIAKKYLIIEFPNEKDSKAKKWTNMGYKDIAEPYSEEIFWRPQKNIFISSKDIEVLLKKDLFIY